MFHSYMRRVGCLALLAALIAGMLVIENPYQSSNAAISFADRGDDLARLPVMYD